jgi:hypothetical protein
MGLCGQREATDYATWYGENQASHRAAVLEAKRLASGIAGGKSSAGA